MTLADAFTFVAIRAGSLIGEMAQVNLDVALRRLGDSEIRLLPEGDPDRRSAISLATAMSERGGPPSPTTCFATMVNSAFGLAVDSVAAAAQGAETTPIRVAKPSRTQGARGAGRGRSITPVKLRPYPSSEGLRLPAFLSAVMPNDLRRICTRVLVSVTIAAPKVSPTTNHRRVETGVPLARLQSGHGDLAEVDAVAGGGVFPNLRRRRRDDIHAGNLAAPWLAGHLRRRT